jgi:hypothetical protein
LKMLSDRLRIAKTVSDAKRMRRPSEED